MLFSVGFRRLSSVVFLLVVSSNLSSAEDEVFTKLSGNTPDFSKESTGGEPMGTPRSFQGTVEPSVSPGTTKPDRWLDSRGLLDKYLEHGKYELGRSDFKKAETQFRAALALSEKLADDSGRVKSLSWLAQAITHQARYTEADGLHRQAVALSEKFYGVKSPGTADALGALASNCERNGKDDEADRSYRRALAIFEEALGVDSPSVAQVLGGLSTLARKHGKLADAERLRRRALSIYEASYGMEHPLVFSNYLDLANLCRKQGKLSETESNYKKALVILEKVRGPEDENVGKFLLGYAQLLEEMKRPEESARLKARASTILDAWAKPDPVQLEVDRNLDQISRSSKE